jgi:hypothetical protein
LSDPVEVSAVAFARNGESLAVLGVGGELEGEMEWEMEEESEAEGAFGAIGSALSGLLGEGEEEYELGELEAGELGELGEMEFGELGELGELEAGELGELGETGFGQESEWESGELEGEGEWELEGEGEWETESGELFFGRLLRRAAPILRRVAKVAVPAVATAFGGPLGGIIGRTVASSLEGEFEGELEGAGELELEGVQEYETHAEAPLTEHEAHAELMAAVAAGAQTETEAEAMIGAAAWGALTARERRALRRVQFHIIRATAILTRLLRRRRVTRPIVRAVPTIVHHTARTLMRQSAATGRPVTRAQAARAMALHTRRVLTNPRVTSMALRRNVTAARQAQRVARVPVRGVRAPVRPQARY